MPFSGYSALKCNKIPERKKHKHKEKLTPNTIKIRNKSTINKMTIVIGTFEHRPFTHKPSAPTGFWNMQTTLTVLFANEQNQMYVLPYSWKLSIQYTCMIFFVYMV